MADRLRARDLAILAAFGDGEKLLAEEVHHRMRQAGSRVVGRSAAGITATLDRLCRRGLVRCERQVGHPRGVWAPRLWGITPQGRATLRRQ